MITAWDVYLVMQLDAAGALLMVLAILSGGFGFFCVSQWVQFRDYEPSYYDLAFDPKSGDRKASPEQLAAAKAKNDKAPVWLNRAGGAAAISLILVAGFFLIPSTRTAAAMILVPKLTSPEVLQPVGAEAKELYGLAKDALRRIGKDDKPEATP